MTSSCLGISTTQMAVTGSHFGCLACSCFLKTGVGLGTLFNGHNAASSADGIPLDTFTPAGVRTVVTLFALWGLSQLMICLLGVLVLVRYRAMVPVMFALFLLEHLGRTAILQIMPIDTRGSPPGHFINLALLAIMIAGLALSLWDKGDHPRTKADFR